MARSFALEVMVGISNAPLEGFLGNFTQETQHQEPSNRCIQGIHTCYAMACAHQEFCSGSSNLLKVGECSSQLGIGGDATIPG